MAENLVIIPTYNESENIQQIISSVLSLPLNFDILIVDDNSPDGTAQMVIDIQKQYPNRVFLEVRTQKKGLGTAYIHGFRWALQRPYQYICEMDADFSHNPQDLCRLQSACADEHFDVAIGSRYIDGVNVTHWPLRRILLSYGASFYVRFITKMPIYDPTAGFICYRREIIERINLDDIHFVGYAFQIQMKFETFINKAKIIEIPIVFTNRQKGKSKMNGSIIKEAIWGVISMKIKHLTRKYCKH